MADRRFAVKPTSKKGAKAMPVVILSVVAIIFVVAARIKLQRRIISSARKNCEDV